MFGEELTLYHKILTFNDPKRKGFGKDCGKSNQHFLLFPVFSTLSKRKSVIPN